MSKSKKQRQQWWNRLTPEQRDDYFKKKQAQKAEARKLNPPKELKGLLFWAVIIWFVFSGE